MRRFILKNILITGASGFIGSRLIRIAKEWFSDDAQIIILTSKPIEGFKNLLYQDAYSFTGQDFIDNGVDRIDIVIHIGGFVSKTDAQKRDYAANHATIVNTQYLLEHLPVLPKKFILCSSTDVYGTFSDYPNNAQIINEVSPVIINEQYSLAKYCCELLVKEWAEINAVTYQILRLGPIYGIGDKRTNFLVGAMLLKAVKGENILLSADPKTKRNLLYIDDLCRFILNSTKIEGSEVINVVSENNTSFFDIVKAIILASGNVIRFEVDEKYIPARNRAFDASKRISLLGREEINLNQGIKMTFEWMKHNVEK